MMKGSPNAQDEPVNLELELGAYLKRAREKLQLSQEYVALMLGYKDHATISLIESGRRNVPRACISKLSSVLALNENHLIDRMTTIYQNRLQRGQRND